MGKSDRKKSKKKSRKSSRRDEDELDDRRSRKRRNEDDESDDDDDEGEDRKSRGKDKRKSSKRKHKDERRRKKRKRDEDSVSDGDDDSDDHRNDGTGSDGNSNSDDEGSDDSNEKRKRRKKTKKRDRKDSDESKDKKQKKRDKRREEKDKKKKKHKRDKKDKKATNIPANLQRSFDFADSLYELLNSHPALATDLPIMLVRMAGGATFDFSSMSDRAAAMGLSAVFEKLSSFGVVCVSGSWMWKAPPGNSGRSFDLLLVQISRGLLDQIGFTMEAVNNYGRIPKKPEPKAKETSEGTKADSNDGDSTKKSALETLTEALLKKFIKMDATIAGQLGELCSMILNGESVSIDGIPNEDLKSSLEDLFNGAGLEKAEMDNDDDSDDDDDDSDDDGPSYGFSLPNEEESEVVATNLSLILNTCKEVAMNPPKTRVKGPLPLHMASEYANDERNDSAKASRNNRMDDDDDDDDHGPAPLGSVRRKEVAVSDDIVEAMAEQRKQQLDDLDPTKVKVTEPGQREEWMTSPGEHDLLQGIKAGNGLKGRTFENKKRRGAQNIQSLAPKPIHAAVKAQVDAIMDIHKQARGPSLMEQHRLKQAEEKAAKQKAGGEGNNFKWSRDKDLDSGRRVDKNHLQMLMGGAGSGLQDKFQGGLGR